MPQPRRCSPMFVCRVLSARPCLVPGLLLAMLLPGMLPGSLSGLLSVLPSGIAGPGFGASIARADEFPIPRIAWEPRGYVCRPAPAPIVIDGVLEDAWDQAAWTEPFVDIEGSRKPAPPLNTRVKMLWDGRYFYVAARLEQPHVWATLRERDSVIYHDDDFEVFIDPDGDTHEYYELEVNAFGTEWDLLLLRPYRDGAPAVDAWDIQGLQTAVAVEGTLNDPRDRDEGWSVEIAFPWGVLEECAHRTVPPEDGDRWRVNFSRVEWKKEVVGNAYIKKTDPDTGRALPEHNWVWSPQGLVAMHYPEMWGYVEFRASDRPKTSSRPAPAVPPVPPVPPEQDRHAYRLRQIYYKQKAYHARHGVYATRLDDLVAEPPGMPDWERLRAHLSLAATPDAYILTFEAPGGWIHRLREDGRAWRRRAPAVSPGR